MKVAYRTIKFGPEVKKIIGQANTIIGEYQAMGYVLTLRQLYYRFVAADYLANNVQNYKRLGDIIMKARYAGEVDWSAIEDRTRNLGKTSHWTDPGDVINSAAEGYAIDKWEDQPYRIEVWVEKEALAGIVSQVASELDVSYMACRGYMSASEMRDAALRFVDYSTRGQIPKILHLWDHDPSGTDMTRDIQERLDEFCARHGKSAPHVDRIALNMDQVLEYNPPPNPAKETDSRHTGYVEKYDTDESWELDALPPQDLAALIRSNVIALRDEERWEEAQQTEDRHRSGLRLAASRWDDVAAFIEGSTL